MRHGGRRAAIGVIALIAVAGCDDAGELAAVRAAITNATPDAGDPAVVAVLAGGEVRCTATLAAPRVAVTAAHCVVSTTIGEVRFGPDAATGTAIAVVEARVAPGFDSHTLADDVAVLLLADPAPASIAPIALRTAPLTADDAGRAIRLVGYGQTAPTSGAGAKLTGAAVIDAVADRAIDLAADPSLTCGGDSGGPALLDDGAGEVLAAITSGGDAGCADFTRSTRADRFVDFVADFVAATADATAAVGDRCYYDAHCTTGTCVYPDDAPTIGYCTGACAGDADCPVGMACAATECRYAAPSPGALGATCTTYDDCDSGLCVHAVDDAGGGACAEPCASEADACPDGFACLPAPDQPGLDACLAPTDPDPPTAGGCNAGRDPGAGVLGLALLALAIATLRAPASGTGGSDRRPTRARPR